MEYTLMDGSAKTTAQTLPVFSPAPEERPTTSGISILDKKQEFNILERLKKLRDQRHFCDVVLEVRGTQLQAHKNVLASWSPYFASKLFPGDSKVLRDHVVVYYDNSEVFADLLDFMYNGYVAPRETNFLQLLHLAVSFQIVTLQNYCEEFLRCNLHLGNFVTSYFLSRKYRLENLEEYIVGFLQLNLSDAVKQGEFLSLNAGKFNAFLSKGWMEKIKPEIKLFLIISWVGYDVQEREKYLVLLLGHIDWSTVANDFLLEINRTENFFTSHESSLYLLLQTLFSTGIQLGPYTDIFPQLRETHCAILNEVVHSSVLPVESEDYQQVTIVVKPRPAFREAITSTDREGLYETTESSVNTDVNSQHFAEAERAAEEMNNMEETEIAPRTDDSSMRIDDEFGKFLESEIQEINQKEKENSAKDTKKVHTVKADQVKTVITSPEVQGTRMSSRRSKKVTSYAELAGMVDTENDPVAVTAEEEDDMLGFKEDFVEEETDEIDKEHKPSVDVASGTEQNTNKTRDTILLQMKVNKKAKPKPCRTKTIKPGKAISCEYKDCAYITKFEKRMEKHVRTAHQSSFELSCSYCQFNTKEVRKYNNHMKKHFPGPPFTCDFPRCTFSAERIGSLLSHKSGHTDERPFTCECGMRFRTNNTLIAHKKVHLGKKEFVCPECNAAFATKNTMSQHMVTHSDIRPYLCDLCGFSTKFQSHLIAHKRIHSGEVFRCQFPKCTYFSPKRSQLKAHMRAHLGIRAHVCPVCAKSFVERSHLVRHERLHTAELLKCVDCDYSTTRKDKLKEHIYKYHTGEKPKRCRTSNIKKTVTKDKKEVVTKEKKSGTTPRISNPGNAVAAAPDITAPMLVKWDHGGYSLSQVEPGEAPPEGGDETETTYCVLRDQLTTNEPIPQILSVDQMNAQISLGKDLDGEDHDTTTLTAVSCTEVMASAVTDTHTLVGSPGGVPPGPGGLGMVGSNPGGQLDGVVSGAIVTSGMDSDQGSHTYTIIQQPPGNTSQAQDYNGFMVLF